MTKEIKATAPTREELFEEVKRLNDKCERIERVNAELRKVVNAKHRKLENKAND